MSFLSALILPALEKQLLALEPQLAQFAITELESIGKMILDWVAQKGNAAAATPVTTAASQ